MCTIVMKSRRVRFNLSANVTYDNHQLCREDVDSMLWYADTDYTKFKENNLQACMDIISQEQGKEDDISSYTHVMECVYNTCSSSDLEQDSCLSDTECSDLEEVLNIDHLGIERTTVQIIDRDKRWRRREIVHAVLDIQEDFRHSKKRDVLVEMIAQAARELSRPSRMFAAHLARALNFSKVC